jgi:transposase
MFLRTCRKRKNGKTHTYWALVESYRTPKGSRQRVLAYLGELAAGEQSGWAKLSQKLAGKEQTADGKPPERIRTLFQLAPAPELPQEHSEEAVLVRVRGVRLERSRDFGDVYLGWCAWRLLGLDTFLKKVLPAGREDVPWHQMAAVLTLARFCEPSSEHHIETVWYPRTALDGILDIPAEKIHTDRLYAALDHLLPLKSRLEAHLRDTCQTLFDLKYEILLYDITSTYFEGKCEDNPCAKRGHSRDKRPDCPQVLIGLVVTEDGFPLGYEVYDGNKHDSTTVQYVIDAVEKKYGRLHRVWIMDRGMVSDANLSYLRERGSSYIVGMPKAQLVHFKSEIQADGWQAVENGVEVKLIRDQEAKETYVLARSGDRREKEKAMHDRFESRMEEGLKKLQAAAQSGRLKSVDLAQQRLGRLTQKYTRSAGAFDVQITSIAVTPIPQTSQDAAAKPKAKPKPQAKVTPQVQVTWTRNTDWTEWARVSEGCYVLRSNLEESDPKVLWKRYIQLTDVEAAFRITKDELEIRPIWHQKEDRVKAHILVCFLAYALWKTLEGWMHRSGLGDAPRSVLDEIAKIKSGDVVLPTQNSKGEPLAEIRLRCVTEPEPAQKVLLNRLGLELPRRLRQSIGSVEM